jgi:hypothetical protein
MERFAPPGHLAGWAGIAPGYYQSAGKAGSNQTGPGSRWLAAALGLVELSAGRSKDTYLRERYRRLAPRIGGQSANVAPQRDILTAVCTLQPQCRVVSRIERRHFGTRRPRSCGTPSESSSRRERNLSRRDRRALCGHRQPLRRATTALGLSADELCHRWIAPTLGRQAARAETMLLAEPLPASLRQIAELAGSSPDTVRTVKAGLRGSPTSTELKVSSLLGLSLSAIEMVGCMVAAE